MLCTFIHILSKWISGEGEGGRCSVNAVGSFFRVLQNRVVEETRCKLFIVYCWSVYTLGCMCVCAGVRERVQRNWGANVHWGLFSCWSIVGQAGSQLSVTHAHTHTHPFPLPDCIAHWEKTWQEDWFKWSWLLSLRWKIIWWWKGRKSMLGLKKKKN